MHVHVKYSCGVHTSGDGCTYDVLVVQGLENLLDHTRMNLLDGQALEPSCFARNARITTHLANTALTLDIPHTFAVFRYPSSMLPRGPGSDRCGPHEVFNSATFLPVRWFF